MGTENDSSVYTSVHRPRKQMVIDNFLGGLAWSAGTIIGGSVLLIIVGFILKYALRNVNLIPVFGNFTANVIEQTAKTQQLLATPTPKPVQYQYPK